MMFNALHLCPLYCLQLEQDAVVEAISAGNGEIHFQVHRELLVQVCHASYSLQFREPLAVLNSLVVMFLIAF